MSRFKATTKKGHSLFEVSSSFQKSVRRGMEEEAMYWAVELFESRYDNYLWKRIRIISSEDVGLANPVMSQQIYALWMMYQEQKKAKDEKNRPERLFLTHAVILLCRSKKSRVIDHALLHHWSEHDHLSKPIPGFAYDKHTTEGKRLGLGWEHFFDEASKLENVANVEGEAYYKEIARKSVLTPRKEKQKGAPTLFAMILAVLH